jgi:hypothetical protein
LDPFWRSDRSRLLFPHSRRAKASKSWNAPVAAI